jgi:alkanesulfonate monooxygenase SsuD/methylene tetrahydromethanopterin reductase-like flavin-dependent oxidoreductase (luciferase family)
MPGVLAGARSLSLRLFLVAEVGRGGIRREALDIIRRLLAGETVSSFRCYRIAEASRALRPAEPVEVWICSSAPSAIDRAARLAEGWIARPGLTYEEARAQADFYRGRCAAYGRQSGVRHRIAARHLRRRVVVRGTGGIAACAKPKLSRHAGRSPDRGIDRRSRGKLSDLRETGYTDILSLERLAAVLAALV